MYFDLLFWGQLWASLCLQTLSSAVSAQVLHIQCLDNVTTGVVRGELGPKSGPGLSGPQNPTS